MLYDVFAEIVVYKVGRGAKREIKIDDRVKCDRYVRVSKTSFIMTSIVHVGMEYRMDI